MVEDYQNGTAFMVHVPIALPAVAASHVAPAEFFISCDASSLIVYVLPSTSSLASCTTVALPSTFVPAGVESTDPFAPLFQ